MQLFKAQVPYTNGTTYHLYSENKQELINILCNLVFSNPGLYEIVSFYTYRGKLIGIIGPDGAYRDKDR